MEDERQIIKKVLAGDSAAFAEIVRLHRPHVFKIVANMVSWPEIEEVAHEVFIRAYKHLPGYRSTAPFEHWLSKVAVRTCYDYWRRRRRQKVTPVSDEELQALEREVSRLDRFEVQAVERARELLDWALDHLGPADRLAFSLLYLEEMSMKEVAGALGWSIPQVKMRSFRARRLLRKRLQEKLER